MQLWLAELDLEVVEEENPGEADQHPRDQQHHYLPVSMLIILFEMNDL